MHRCEGSLFGGITLERARELHRQAAQQKFTGKKIWHVHVDSPIPVGSETETERFNLFCTAAEYSPVTLTGERRQVGASFTQSLTGAEGVELRLTTMDSSDGEIKRWFQALSALAAPPDGTINPPARYATRFIIRHGVVDLESIPPDAFREQALFQPASIETSLNRAESGPQELSLSFTQLDGFMPSDQLPWMMTI